MCIEYVDINRDEKEVLPSKLYKYYGSIDYAKSAIIKKGVYLAKPSSFNDPFDELYSVLHFGSTKYKTLCTYQEIINYFLSSSDYIENNWGRINFEQVVTDIYNRQNDLIISIDDAVKEFLEILNISGIKANEIVNDICNKRSKNKVNINDEQLKISCFCTNYTSVPMWAYYGKSHTGICIEYDTTLLPQEVKKHLHSIKYCVNRNNDEMHFSKSVEWQHECEWRIIVRAYENDYLPFDCITGIYLGERFDFSNNPSEPTVWTKKESFANKKYNYYCDIISEIKKSNNNITIYKAETDIKQYRINYNKIYEHKGGGDR